MVKEEAGLCWAVKAVWRGAEPPSCRAAEAPLVGGAARTRTHTAYTLRHAPRAAGWGRETTRHLCRAAGWGRETTRDPFGAAGWGRRTTSTLVGAAGWGRRTTSSLFGAAGWSLDGVGDLFGAAGWSLDGAGEQTGPLVTLLTGSGKTGLLTLMVRKPIENHADPIEIRALPAAPWRALHSGHGE